MKDLAETVWGESSESIRARVQAARDIQNKRFSNGEAKDIVCNADMRIGEVRQFCQLQPDLPPAFLAKIILAVDLTLILCR